MKSAPTPLLAMWETMQLGLRLHNVVICVQTAIEVVPGFGTETHLATPARTHRQLPQTQALAQLAGNLVPWSPPLACWALPLFKEG